MLDESQQPDLDIAIEHLTTMRRTGPWSLTAIVPDGPITSATFTDAGKARAWLAKHVGKANLHYVPNLVRKPTGRGGRVQKADIEMIEFLHGDFDLDKLPDDAPLAPQPMRTRKAAVANDMEMYEMMPTLLVDSGGGVQGLWRLAEPVPATPENIDWAEGANRWLAQEYAGGEPQCANIDHLLRLPGTINYPDARKRKRGRTVVATRLMVQGDGRYERSAFGHIPAPAKTQLDIQFGRPEEVNDLAALGRQFGLSDKLLDIIREGRDPEDPDRLPSRSEWVFSAVNQLHRHGVPPEIIMGVLLNSAWGISESVLEQDEKPGGRTAEDYAAYQVKRAMEKQAGERQADIEQLASSPVDLSALPDDTPPAPDASKPHRYKRYSITELLHLPDPVWTVDGIILERSLVMLYGAPKSYKTFIALDLALCVATGRSFHGVPVAGGRVTYVAAEGHAAETRDRVLAWCHENKVKPSALDGCFALVISGLQLDQSKSVQEFIRLDPAPCDLTFFDTLNRNMEGHESDTQDMTKVVAGCDMVRRELKTAVIVVHHTGVNQERERGSTVLRGAADTRLKVTRSGNVVTLLVEDQRAGPDGKQLHFEPVIMPVDILEARDSVVMRSTLAPTPRGRARGKLIAPTDLLLLEIHNSQPKVQADLVDRSVEGRSQSRVSANVQALIRDGLLEKNSLTLTPAGVKKVEKLLAD